ncbi:MAG: 5-formyltetrahydrofolate cyclo-ligase [Bdellovibrionota bacterium]
MVSKAELRKKFKSILGLRSANNVKRSENDSHQFGQQLELFFKSKTGAWGAFHPLDSEPAILPCLPEIRHINWFFPRIQGEVLEFSNSKKTQKNNLGFAEPVGGEVRSVQELDGFLIPGLVFDRKGNRLGRGKGYYDRSLAQCRGERVGVCYQDQLIEKLDVAEAHDLAMDYILTENEAVTCKSLAKGS